MPAFFVICRRRVHIRCMPEMRPFRFWRNGIVT
uniref:Uncharacterized protein n=1 Tax=virus sp. ct5rm7 TaxID=2827298 RepID=A0A8S5RG19_9VIRU|nr:MAG TPA: protein of unknown function (DUF1970) [virus sp. ct5rm7]